MKLDIKIHVSDMIMTTQGNCELILDFSNYKFTYSPVSLDLYIVIKTTNIRKFLKHCHRLRREYGC